MEGALPEDGLAAYGDDLIIGVGGAGHKWEQDDGWKSVEVEPEAVEVHTNGTNGNGHHANGVGRSVELVPGGDRHAEAVVNGNGKGHAAECFGVSTFRIARW